ncbi:phosphotransferase [Candidatus Pelagibacter sp. HIMB1542]|uniref:phosphotransferase n=1 Tax=Candidatus Pelagibacter sp. HIMB1542 TaxID=3413346 RepID=UPI003F833DF6
MKNSKDLQKIKGDASFRTFYRRKKNNSIIVYAKKEKKKNLLIYDAVNKVLINNKILAPSLISHNYKKNFIEIEDFGNVSLFKILKNKKRNKYLFFKNIIHILNKLQSIKTKKIKNFLNQNYKLELYKNKILYNEAKLFSDWYVEKKLNRNKSLFKKKFKNEINKLLSKLNNKNITFVHRDFHVSNLMYFKNQIGLIDNQDALIGNKAYDLASLIDDVRLKTNNKLKKKIFDYYIKTNKKINLIKFKHDFEILSVLRNLKIIGIFTRLAHRDNKKKYIQLIPYTWEMIDYRLKQNKIFKDLKLLLKNNFPEFIN